MTSKRHPTRVGDTFIGLAFILQDQPAGTEDGEDQGRDLEYTCVLHDGTGVTESETFHMTIYTLGKDEDGMTEEVKRVRNEVFGMIAKVQKSQSLNVGLLRSKWPLLTAGRSGSLRWPSRYRRN
jgi:hypothetical protein